jgi:hypothetical protein
MRRRRIVTGEFIFVEQFFFFFLLLFFFTTSLVRRIDVQRVFCARRCGTVGLFRRCLLGWRLLFTFEDGHKDRFHPLQCRNFRHMHGLVDGPSAARRRQGHEIAHGPQYRGQPHTPCTRV